MYDLAIIGCGPAGISAALTARKRGLNFVLIGRASLTSKMALAPEVDNYPGVASVSGKELAKAFLSQLDSLGITPLPLQAQTIYAFGGTFLIATAEEPIEAKSVIVATGSVVKKPLPGELEFLGKGVSYCATCDGMLYKGKTVAILMDAPEAEEANFVSALAAKTYLATRLDATNIKNVERVQAYAKEIIGDKTVKAIRWSDGTETAVDGVFILKTSLSPDVLVPGVETSNGAIIVDRHQETNIPGLYAAGDITGEPLQYAKAVGEGCTAAYFAAKEIAKEKLAK